MTDLPSHREVPAAGLAVARRRLLKAGAVGAGALAATTLAGGTAAGFSRSGRPVLTHGVQSGDVERHSAMVWTRADRPSRMLVEVSADPSFLRSRVVRGPVLSPETGGTGKLRLRGLPTGADTYYRVTAEDLDGRVTSEPVTGRLRTAPKGRSDVRLTWSGDVAGQGWGINADIGGMPAYTAMARRRPDLFLHCGDTVYADGPLEESVTLPDGRVYRNVVTEAKSKVAETLDEYRGQFAYNLLADSVREFNAVTPSYVQWDDHEVVNNWYPGEILDLPEYTEKRVDVLARRAFRAFHEWHPIDPKAAEDGRVYRNFAYGDHVEVFVLDMRSYKDRNDGDAHRDGSVLGERQAAWLVRALARSRATWKIVQADLPIGLAVADGDAGAMEGVSNGVGGAPGGRETELAWVLSEVARRQVRNVVWLTADVHYTAAHHYSPERASFTDFAPFWEFVSGPLHAGAFGPGDLDGTFGPKAVFTHAPPADGQNASPMEGFQHFGEINVDGPSGALTVDLRDGTGASLWSKTLQPE
ncbi:alkaline phosphatase D family protein [Prauserella alba]|uniref:Alkaline phosphatase D family protein n=1 Tax=Prauserella alba TaxID=176898 RepID=A0ABN1VAR5_9PSEU|nr:alkaline phosphatase D family protein [Prauserella alba]MCP2179420.1 alkaline phosphatase D [Prauserella alba]